MAACFTETQTNSLCSSLRSSLRSFSSAIVSSLITPPFPSGTVALAPTVMAGTCTRLLTFPPARSSSSTSGL
eukprot:5407308-Pyramimonas_sp.AAC.1